MIHDAMKFNQQQKGGGNVDMLLANQTDLPVENYSTRPSSSANKARPLSRQNTLFPSSKDLAQDSPFDAPALAPKGI